MAHRRTNPKTFAFAQELRHHPTIAEALLWRRLRAHRLSGAGFRRQHAIGPFIVDFCAPRAKLIIELDGSHHLDQKAYDGERTAYLENRGYHVIRFWNDAVLKNVDAVLRILDEHLQQNKAQPLKSVEKEIS